jgi:hypothetical protein
MRVALVMFLALICGGCEGVSLQTKSQPTPTQATATHPHFEFHPSSNETFLLDTDEGKVWKYDSKQNAFLEIPVTSKILKYDSKGDRIIDPSKPDSKDPLGLFDDKKDEKKQDCASRNLSFKEWKACRDAGAYKKQ